MKTVEALPGIHKSFLNFTVFLFSFFTFPLAVMLNEAAFQCEARHKSFSEAVRVHLKEPLPKSRKMLCSETRTQAVRSALSLDEPEAHPDKSRSTKKAAHP